MRHKTCFIGDRLWIGAAIIHRGFLVAMAIYPQRRQFQVALLWPRYLPLLIVQTR